MENTVPNIAVISFPRTASKSLAKWYGKIFDKPVALGSLHAPQFYGSNIYNTQEIIKAKTHILHGHWHSLDKLDKDSLVNLYNNYRIVTSYREQSMVKQSILRITGEDLFDEILAKTIAERSKWNIWRNHIVEGENVEIVSCAPEGFC